jgi:hypothetical protein
MPNAAAQLVVDPLLWHGIFSSVEESERMYSGTSSVPKISSGSKSRLDEQRRMNCEVANRGKIRD